MTESKSQDVLAGFYLGTARQLMHPIRDVGDVSYQGMACLIGCQSQDCLCAYQDPQTVFISLSMNKQQEEKKQAVSFFRERSCRVWSCNLVGRLWVSISQEQQSLQRWGVSIPKTYSKDCQPSEQITSLLQTRTPKLPCAVSQPGKQQN